MVHYDGNIQPHMHFTCNCLRKQSMILIIMIKKLLNNLKKHASIILMLLISMSGICEKCLEKRAAIAVF